MIPAEIQPETMRAMERDPETIDRDRRLLDREEEDAARAERRMPRARALATHVRRIGGDDCGRRYDIGCCRDVCM